MSHNKETENARTLAPYRKKIDLLDEQIIELLRQRYDVIEEVGHLKTRENIPSVIESRVEEVIRNAERMAAAKGLDSKFIRDLYRQLVIHSCNLEEEIIMSPKTKLNNHG